MQAADPYLKFRCFVADTYVEGTPVFAATTTATFERPRCRATTRIGNTFSRRTLQLFFITQATTPTGYFRGAALSELAHLSQPSQ
jgi:hypothetical protein